MEEVIFVEKKLLLKEEVHLRRARRSGPFQELVTLREQAAVITRVGADDQEAPSSSKAPSQSRDA